MRTDLRDATGPAAVRAGLYFHWCTAVGGRLGHPEGQAPDDLDVGDRSGRVDRDLELDGAFDPGAAREIRIDGLHARDERRAFEETGRRRAPGPRGPRTAARAPGSPRKRRLPRSSSSSGSSGGGSPSRSMTVRFFSGFTFSGSIAGWRGSGGMRSTAAELTNAISHFLSRNAK